MKLNKKEIKEVKEKIARETTIALYTHEESRQDLDRFADDEGDNFITPVKAEYRDQSQDKVKQHRYYIDIDDIQKMLKRSQNVLRTASFDDFNKVQPTSAATSLIAGDDHEASLILKFIEDRCGKVELSDHKIDYRVY